MPGPRSNDTPPHIRLFIRVQFDDGSVFGPGKVRLLELIGELGSIRAAALAMGMSYKHAWDKLESMQTTFGKPLVAARVGGSKGGGSALTALGRTVVSHYRNLERLALSAASPMLRDLDERVSRG